MKKEKKDLVQLELNCTMAKKLLDINQFVGFMEFLYTIQIFCMRVQDYLRLISITEEFAEFSQITFFFFYFMF